MEPAFDVEIPAPWSDEEREAFFQRMETEDIPLFMEDASGDSEAAKQLRALVYDDEDTPMALAETKKAKANELFKKGPDFYANALRSYNESIKHLDCVDDQTSIDVRKLRGTIYSNIAAINMNQKRYSKVLQFCLKSIEAFPLNFKTFFRAAKASYELGRNMDAVRFAQQGLSLEPMSEALKQISDLAEKRIESKKQEQIRKELEGDEAEKKNEILLKAFEARELRVGKVVFPQMLQHTEKPYLAKDYSLHWPVLFLYEEYAQTDFVQDFDERSTFEDQLKVILPRNGPFAPWDAHSKYSYDQIELYYQEYQVPATKFGSSPEVPESEKCWTRIPLQRTLADVLAEKAYVVPRYPLFYVIAKGTSFHASFLRAHGDKIKNMVKSVCAKCGKEEEDRAFKRCARCFSVAYCSRDCQKAHWSKHKKPCKAARK
eukprot:TRINITY_DN25967_c0_g1_i1.p1 TRINITY_DN25967_c0_g1~~TRINITY_DN25967_c0_g1_i1.p1  ORF type:complete len:431 (+),score=141.60 TRINITY_DN25967_c0_g1_i1:36-1328(+)